MPRRRLRGAALLPLLALVVALSAACEGEESLNRFGAEDSHRYEFQLEVGDDYLVLAGDAPGVPPLIEVLAHSDVTLTVRNAGAVEHTITLYGGSQQSDPLVSTGVLPPGASGMLAFHFHDPQLTVLRDDARPLDIFGRIRASEETE
jgi:hypothetical protein